MDRRHVGALALGLAACAGPTHQRGERLAEADRGQARGEGRGRPFAHRRRRHLRADQKHGVELAAARVDEAGGVNRARLVLVIDDDQSTTSGGVTCFRTEVGADRVVAILGPTLSHTAVAAHQVAQRAQTRSSRLEHRRRCRKQVRLRPVSLHLPRLAERVDRDPDGRPLARAGRR